MYETKPTDRIEQCNFPRTSEIKRLGIMMKPTTRNVNWNDVKLIADNLSRVVGEQVTISVSVNVRYFITGADPEEE